MTPEEFVLRYGQALSTQDWKVVGPLVHNNASVTFSDGSTHKGKEAVRTAYERNFQAIAREKYKISNVYWVLVSRDTAVYMFDFRWSGIINGQPASGAGRGTAVIINNDGEWKLLAEHLGPYP